MERVFLASLLLTWAFVLYQALYGNGMQEMPASAQLFLACDLVAATYGTLLMLRKCYIRSVYPNRSCMYVTAREGVITAGSLQAVCDGAPLRGGLLPTPRDHAED